MAEINNSQRKKIVKVGLLETFAELVDTLYGSPMGASGTNHAPGLVPDPGATAGSSKFLCEDGTWKVPSGGGGGNSVSVMGGSGENHASGLVPDPGATAGTTKFLREDGTWNTPTKLLLGLENVGNFKAVSTVASLGLTSTELGNARTNIGLGEAATRAVDSVITSESTNLITSGAVYAMCGNIESLLASI